MGGHFRVKYLQTPDSSLLYICTSLMFVPVQHLYQSNVCISPTFVLVQSWYQSSLCNSLAFVSVWCWYQYNVCTSTMFVPVQHCTSLTLVPVQDLSTIYTSLTFLPVWPLYSLSFVLFDVFGSDVWMFVKCDCHTLKFCKTPYYNIQRPACQLSYFNFKYGCYWALWW